ncbi:MAG: helix-turn-helix domain-containing protein [Sphingomonadales bacterium]|nr:helix-turn-helix domain-containing protein [Sphingomonadales bacterium]
MEKQELNAFSRGLKIAMDQDGWKMRPLSEAAGLGESAVKDIFRKALSPKISTCYAIAQAMGRSLDEIIELGNGNLDNTSRAAISVAGRVGAGAEIELIDAWPKGEGLYHVACPPGLPPHGIVAVEVAGDSMAPIYEPGSVLFYARQAMGVPTEALGRICIAADTENRVWLKQVKPGTAPGLFHLISINPAGLNMHDARLSWAAPVKLHLPPDLVRRI